LEDGSFRSNIAIVGLGLIGGSYAMALRQNTAGRIFGIDIDERVLEKAVRCGAIDQGSIDAEEILSKSEIVIIALYPREAIEFLKSNAKNFKPGTLVTDTCGIKQPIIDAACKFLQPDVEFIGGHPMAGNEFQGFDAASKELFIDTNYIITPYESNSQKAIMTIERLAELIGCNPVTSIKANDHDRIISFTSQLPHIVAISVASLVTGEKNMRAFSGRSFMDATRVAALNKELWTQIFGMNKTNVINRIEDMEGMLGKLKNAINSQDEDSLQGIFDNAIIGKREMRG
jgi:prephenate dehydrogenase